MLFLTIRRHLTIKNIIKILSNHNMSKYPISFTFKFTKNHTWKFTLQTKDEIS